jgi:hypothetical protein
MIDYRPARLVARLDGYVLKIAGARIEAVDVGIFLKRSSR